MIDAAIASLIRDRVPSGTVVSPSSDTVDINGRMPRVAYTLIRTTRDYSDDGNSGLTSARYQVDYFDNLMTDCRAMADKVRIALDGYSGTKEGTRIERIYFDSERFQHAEESGGGFIARHLQDLIVVYREAMTN